MQKYAAWYIVDDETHWQLMSLEQWVSWDAYWERHEEAQDGMVRDVSLLSSSKSTASLDGPGVVDALAGMIDPGGTSWTRDGSLWMVRPAAKLGIMHTRNAILRPRGIVMGEFADPAV